MANKSVVSRMKNQKSLCSFCRQAGPQNPALTLAVEGAFDSCESERGRSWIVSTETCPIYPGGVGPDRAQ